MPLPTSADVHVDELLTNVLVAYFQDQADYGADKVFPIVRSAKESGRYGVYNLGDLTRIEGRRRGTHAESAGLGFRLDTTPTYFCDTWAVHKDVSARERANQTDPIDLDRVTTKLVTDQLLKLRDREWVTAFLAAGIWTGDQTGVAVGPGANQFLQWDNPASTPIEVIATQAYTVWGRTGFKPNVFACGPHVYRNLRNHPDIVDRIGEAGESPRVVALQQLATILDVEKIVVLGGVRNTAVENAARAVDFIAGRAAVLCYAAPAPALEMPSAGYIVVWDNPEAFGPGSAVGSRIVRIPVPLHGLGTERIEAEMAFDMVRVEADLGVFFATAVA